MIDQPDAPPMISMRQIKLQAQSLELLGRLVDQNILFFSHSHIVDLAVTIGLGERDVRGALRYLKQEDWIALIRKDLWVVTRMRKSREPVPPFVIAMAVVSPAAISYWSALKHHGLVTKEAPLVYVLTQTNPSLHRYRRRGEIVLPPHVYPVGSHKFHIVQIKTEHFFGITTEYVKSIPIQLTDLERTLWDAVAAPQHCGHWTQVEEAFYAGRDRLDVEKLVDYALRGDIATAKRIGWLLEYQGQPVERLRPLLDLPVRGMRNLNAAGPKDGPCNRRWMLRINTVRES